MDRKKTISIVPTAPRLATANCCSGATKAPAIWSRFERAAVAWLHKERKVPAGLKIVDWKPETETFGLFGWLFQSLAGAIGTSAERISGLVGQISATLKLDGLVSVWHPASS